MGTSGPRRRLEESFQALTLPSKASRLFGRRKGRPLRTGKALLMGSLLPRLLLNIPENQSLAPATLFEFKPENLWLEIGFGGGEHLASQAKNNPKTGFIGCEPFINGVASLLDHIDKLQLKNVRIFPDDARRVLDALPESSVARCFVLFADPWPKARHAKRRFIGPENIPRLARALKPGAELRLATDDMPLASWMRDSLEVSNDFSKIYDEVVPPEGWVETRYEMKALKVGRQPVYLEYRRV